MITKRIISKNGNVSPTSVINLGNKYENVGDTIEFYIPQEYIGFNHFVTIKLPKKSAILLPMLTLKTNVNGEQIPILTISTDITKEAGVYEMIFYATENVATDASALPDAKIQFISSTFYGEVKDNFLGPDMQPSEVDANIKNVYEDLFNLYKEIEKKLENFELMGPYLYPTVDQESGDISWEAKLVIKDTDGEPYTEVPPTANIKGPQGPYYIPNMDEQGNYGWVGSEDDMPTVTGGSINNTILTAANNKTVEYLNDNLETMVTEGIEEKIVFKWDEEEQALYIYSADAFVYEGGDDNEYDD